MDSIAEKSCLEEISTIVFDSLQKVTLKTISNNWQVTNVVAKDILNKWLKNNEKKLKEIVREFVIQGTNKKGIFTISVVSENNKAILEKKWKDFSSWIYSVEKTSNSKSLNLPEKFEPIHVKNVQINLGNRDLQIPIKQEPSTSQIDTTKIKTPFGMVKPLDKKEIKKEKEEVKSQQNNTVEATVKDEKVKAVESSKEELPQKSSPESKPTNSKGNNKKNAKTQPAVQGKGNITSFFNKPSNKSNSNAEKKEASSIKVKEEIESEKKKEETSRKRSATPEKPKEVSKKKPASKKLKLKNEPNKKRARIQVMEDSSEEEDEEPQIAEEPDSKFIKFDREMTPENKIRSPIKDKEMEVEPEIKEEIQKKHKNKAKRWVTKRFETDDGFIRTEKVLEEYSASEDENDENKKKNSPIQQQQQQEKEISPSSKKTPQKKITAKTKVKDMPAKTKQGSIMNFFSKK